MSWIKLAIHPEHHKVLVISDETGESPEKCFAAIVRWFFHLDEHYDEGHITVSEASFHRITHWQGRKSLAAAMRHQEVGWLEAAENDRLRPTRPESHFSRSAKLRALGAKRASDHRERNEKVTRPALQDRHLEKIREDGGFAKPHPPPAKPVAEDGAVFIALCDCGFTTGRAYRLAGHPNATPERVKGLIDEATKAGTKLKDPLAFIAAGIRDAWVPSSPDDFKPSKPRETPKERAARIVAKMNGATT